MRHQRCWRQQPQLILSPVSMPDVSLEASYERMFVWEPNSDSQSSGPQRVAIPFWCEAWKCGKVQQQCRGSRDAAVAKSTRNLQDATLGLVLGFVARCSVLLLRSAELETPAGNVLKRVLKLDPQPPEFAA